MKGDILVVESIVIEVTTIYLGNDFPVLGCPVHIQDGRIPYSPVASQGKVRLFPSPTHMRILTVLDTFHKRMHIPI
jgi:hypothetical protein